MLERFDFSFKSTEKTVTDFEVKSIQKFSDVGPNVDEPKRQLSDLMVITLFVHFYTKVNLVYH